MATRTETRNLVGYRAADQTHDFQLNRGIIQVPVASRTAAMRLIRLHGGTGQRVVSFRFVRQGKPPVLPIMADTSGDTLLAARVSPATPTPSATGSGLDWSVEGEYIYAQNTPRVVGTNPIPVGQLPYSDPGLTAEAANATPPSLINSYVLNYSQSPSYAYNALIEGLAAATTINALGDYVWPFFAIPTVFSSSHIIQD
jgi:hypothetical protein